MKIQKIPGLFLILTILFSFNLPVKKNSTKNSLIKSIVVSGETTTKFIYNEKDKLCEIESIHGYHKFFYDENGRLTRTDDAMDPTALSSSWSPNQKKVMMTAKNSTITSYDLFEYNKENHIKKIKHYSKKNRHIEFVSITNFIYKGDYVVQCNLTDTKGDIVYHFNTYTYDKNGNATNEKYYVISAPNYYIPKLISETQYTFDDKANPYSVYKMLGRPGYDTNPNNVIERYYILHDHSTKDNVNSSTKSFFTYDENGLPLTEKNGRATFEYQYYE